MILVHQKEPNESFNKFYLVRLKARNMEHLVKIELTIFLIVLSRPMKEVLTKLTKRNYTQIIQILFIKLNLA